MYKSPANTLFIGKNVVFVSECHSTNTLALQLSQNPSTLEGTVVITENQTAGRGQRGNSWHTEPGKNLTLSVLLKPTFLAVSDQFLLTMSTALAVADFLSSKSVVAISIKWPNDILVHDKKICGILIENQIQGSILQSAIVGVGLNINQELFPLPTATSLLEHTGKETHLPTAFEELLSCIEKRYLQLRQNKIALIKQEYLRCLYWRGERHKFASAEEEFEGVIIGVDASGRLAVDVSDKLQYFEIKSIRYLA